MGLETAEIRDFLASVPFALLMGLEGFEPPIYSFLGISLEGCRLVQARL